MGTVLARSFLSTIRALCVYLLRYKGIITYRTNVCQAKSERLFAIILDKISLFALDERAKLRYNKATLKKV